MKYLINSAVITSFGKFRYDPLTVQDMKVMLEIADWESHVGYKETAKAIEGLTGVTVQVNRKTFKMEAGDQAIVFRLVFPPGTLKPEAVAQREGGLEFILEHCEIGLLTKLE